MKGNKIRQLKHTMPQLSICKIININFGFLGVQIGYSLQSSNTSRILAALGANIEHLSYFWLAAPIAGLIVQPLIGLCSDKTWTRLGRRIPFILLGAFLSTLGMFFLPNSEYFSAIAHPLIFGAIMLLFMDTAFNITMQPFRALVSDMVAPKQRNLGYSIQSLLINLGAVLGALLPFLLNGLGIKNVPPLGAKVAPTVIWSFYIGGATLLLTVLWTTLTTKEYAPPQYFSYHQALDSQPQSSFWGLLKEAPPLMWKIGLVQFFSWFAFFLMWVYTTPAVAYNVWHTSYSDVTSATFNAASNWVGIIFGAYSIFAALYSLIMTRLANRFSCKQVYKWSLFAGGAGLLAMVLIHDQYLLILAMVGVGVAWAAILAMPYAILSQQLPAARVGVYMGIFNATITLPQIAAGLLGGILLAMLHGNVVYMLGIAGISMVIAGIAVLFID